MNALTATVAGREIGRVYIQTGSHKSARRVPAAFARQVIETGAELSIDTARGPQPRRLVCVGGAYYTRVAGGAA